MQSAKFNIGSSSSDIWEKYRPVATKSLNVPGSQLLNPTSGTAVTTINFSDIIEEKTIYDRTGEGMETTYESSIHDFGNQQCIDPDAVSVDDILGNSIVHEIRHLSQSHRGPASMPSNLFVSTLFGNENHTNMTAESFKPAEEMLDQIQRDEDDFEQSRADIPFLQSDSISNPNTPASHIVLQKMHKKISNLSDFSGYFGDSSVSTDLSIGRYFSNRCEDLQKVIPNKSPTKHTPVALVPDSIKQDSKLKEKVGEQTSTKTNNSINDDNDATKQYSIVSLSTIASHLDESDADSPRTFLNKLYSKRSQASIESNVKPLKQSAKNLEDNRFGFVMNEKCQNDGVNISSTDTINCMMNSTKIEDKENQLPGNSFENNIDDQQLYPDMTLGSGCSPIKTKRCDDENIGSIKRCRSSISNHSPPVKNQSPQIYGSEMSNGDDDFNEKKMLSECSTLPSKEHSNNISINTIGNSQHPTTEREQFIETGILRKGDTDLQSDLHGFYRSSSDPIKLSLPAQGSQRIRTYRQDAITVDKRCNSQCSTHSEFTQNDGKFPLKSNTSELVWECIKLRKSVVKSLVIKNTSEKKLSLKIGVNGPGFQIASPSDTDTLILQSYECRTVSITFCPTIIGKAIGKVIFKHLKSWPEEVERSVYLWAYGGSTVLQLQGIERGPVGSSFLKMGETSNIISTTLERTFSIYNKGPLNGVATFFVKPKTNQCINENHITIEPNKCVIRPDSSVTIKVTYKLRRKDVERLREASCEVLTVGTLEVIFGSEPNSQRIASILTRYGSVPSKYKQLEFLVKNFPVASEENFQDFREHIDNVSDIFGCFRTTEIALTVNRTNLDETRNADLTCIDDSVLFRTLCETPKQHAKYQLFESSSKLNDAAMWSVEPKYLEMDPRTNPRESISIRNFFAQTQTFLIESNAGNYLNFSLNSGKIDPQSEQKVHIELKKNIFIPPINSTIKIYIESDCIDIPLKVHSLPYKHI